MRIGIIGGTGRLGRNIIDLALNWKAGDIQIGAVVTREENQYVGQDVGVLASTYCRTNVLIDSDFGSAERNCDVFVDCTNAAAFQNNLDNYERSKKPLVVATTSISATRERLVQLASMFPVLCSPNFSYGMFVFMDIIRCAAKRIDETFDIRIIESHHKMKKDMPSGTAVKMIESIRQVKNNDRLEIATHSIRAGNIVGEHTLLFVNSEDERIEISHKLFSRKSFAYGILKSAEWIMSKDKGFFELKDVLQGDAANCG